MLVKSNRKPSRIMGFTSRALGAPAIVAASCDGMERVVGLVVYTAAGGPPTIEFSNDGITWEVQAAIPADPDILPAGSGYTFDRQVLAWRWVRVSVPDAGVTTVTANVELWPRQ